MYVATILTVEATVCQLKQLFRLRDDIQSFMESYTQYELNTSDVICTTISFFTDNVKADFQRLMNTSFMDNHLKHLLALNGNEKSQNSIKIALRMTSTAADMLQTNLNYIQGFLTKKYSSISSVYINLYFVLIEVFQFFITKKKKLRSDQFRFPDVNGFRFLESVHFSDVAKCAICEDVDLDDVVAFFGVNVCGKCRRFFVVSMRKYASLGFRCLKTNEIGTECRHDEVPNRPDITCRKCRFNRCESLGIVAQYISAISEQQQQGDIICAVCSFTDDIRVFLGNHLCLVCINFFYTCMKLNIFKDFVCSLNSNCDIEWSMNGSNMWQTNCKFCTFSKLSNLGIHRRFLRLLSKKKVEHEKTVSEQKANKSAVICKICRFEALGLRNWLGVLCCNICYLFFDEYMRKKYGVTDGGETSSAVVENVELSTEVGGENVELSPCLTCSGGESTTSLCSYCLLQRFRNARLYERWLLCNGDDKEFRLKFMK